MSDEGVGEFQDFYKFFSEKNYEKSRRFNQSFIYDPEPLKLLLDNLGNPQRDYRTIHVAGTTGKGSAATFIARALGKTMPVGLYVSPHLEKIQERISIQSGNTSTDITSVEFFKIWNLIKKNNLVNDISFFDALTAISMLFFKFKKVEWAVFETGLGGKHDSTNNLNPEFCIITPIGFDHQNILGDTIEKITNEKGGIIKPDKPLYAYVENTQAQVYLKEICLNKKSPLRFFTAPSNTSYIEKNKLFIKWIYEDYFKKQMPEIEYNIKGRLDILKNNPYIVFDSAHNSLSFQDLLFWVKMQSGKWRVYINMMKERNIREIIEMIKLVGNSNFQIEIYLFPMEETGYYQEKDILENDLDIKIIDSKMLKELLHNSEYKHLVAGSMRIYPIIKGLVQGFNR